MAERTQSAEPAVGRALSHLVHWRDYLLGPVDGASLAVFRISFGLIMLWEACRFLGHGWVTAYYIKPAFHFSYPFFSWVKPWPGFGMLWHFGLLGLLAALMALGWFYRLAAWGYCLGYTYLFLLDASRYQNHYYLVCLLSFLLAVVPANSAWSLDAWLRPSRYPGTVPRWSILVLRSQITLVYFFAGVAKLNEDWLLRAEPLSAWMENRSQWLLAAPLLKVPWCVWLMAYGSMLLDLSVGFLLWWRRTFWPAVLLLVLFHGLNAYLFSIGIFPWLMLAALTLFPRPDWPRRLLRRQPPAATAFLTPQAIGLQTAVLVLLHLYLAVQLLVPLRHWLYPGNVHWTELGHCFSWHMKLRFKSVRFQMVVTDQRTDAQRPINPRDYLTYKQFSEMRSRPWMIHQFAHYVADREEALTGGRPIVTVRASASLNRRPWQAFIDPEVDLAAQPLTLGPASWVVPLE